MSSAGVRVDSLRCRFGSKLALSIDKLSLKGGVTAVLGPNGAGKSTLLRVVATVSASGGGLRIDGATVDAGGASLSAVRCRLGYGPQTEGLPPRMRVHDYLDYVASLKEIGPARLRRRWISYVLSLVELSHSQSHRISTLSGGEQRRLVISQALLGDPKLLVLDEPLTALDAEQRSRMVTLIAERGADATVVVATHHGDELAAVCGRVLVLNEGQLVFDGTPERLAGVAAGRTWESSVKPAGAHARAVGPGRYRCVGDAVPDGGEAVEPSVADGYVALIRGR